MKKIVQYTHTHTHTHVNARRNELISLVKHNPKGFWRDLQQRRKHIEKNIIDV